MACTYAENLGSVNNSELCSDCKYRVACGMTWRPFADVGPRLRERIKDRGEARDERDGVKKCNGYESTVGPCLD